MEQTPPEAIARIRADGAVLDLSALGLEVVPPEIRDLNLVDLDISSNSIRLVPDWVGQLSGLVRLRLGGNPIAELPESIGDLRQLEELDLYGDDLRLLPAEIGRLERLRFLGLSRNALTELPDSMRKLHRLHTLYVGYNLLDHLPECLRELRALALLFVSGNSIGIVPSWIGELHRLRELRLAETGISRLPAEIGQLVDLEELYLDDNAIAELPIEAGNLHRLRSLGLSGNPLSPATRLTSETPTGLLGYLRGLQRGWRAPREAKVLVIGEGEVGKTTLIRRLQSGTFLPSSTTTHGIEVEHLELPNDDGDLRLNLWDFGGQEVYRITHQFFFTPQALYLLVWKPRIGTQESAIVDWLRRLRLRIGRSARVVLVATHGDERQPELDLPWLRREFGDMIAGSVAVDSESGAGFGALVPLLVREAARLPYTTIRWPESWLRVRARLLALAKSEPQLSWGAFARLCRDEELEDEECHPLAQLLAEFGYIVHWPDDPTLSDILVLQPEWLTKAISLVLEDTETRRRNGVLEYARARQLWSGDGADRQGFAREHHAFFLRLMERFDVSYRIEGRDAALVGQLVPYERPAGVDAAIDAPGSASVRAICHLSEDPPGLVPWLIVRTNRDWTDPPTHWRRGVVLSRERYQSGALIEQVTPLRLSLRVTAPAPDFFLHVLLDTIEEVAERWPGLEWDFAIPCPGSEAGSACAGEYSLATLTRARAQGLRSLSCHTCLRGGDIEQMLTGFRARVGRSQPRETTDTQQILEHVRALHDSVDDLGVTARSTLVTTTEVADAIRGLFRFLSSEVTDVPRVVTIGSSKPERFEPSRFFKDRHRLTLWCEHQEDPHRVGSYTFDRPREWWIEAAPYIDGLRLLLKGIPLLRSFVELSAAALPESSARHNDLDIIKAELELMAKLGDVALIAPEHVAQHREYSPAKLLSAGSRRVRTLLVDLDPALSFYNLARTPITSTGEFYWVCPDHMRLYDPGLPSLE